MIPCLSFVIYKLTCCTVTTCKLAGQRIGETSLTIDSKTR